MVRDARPLRAAVLTRSAFDVIVSELLKCQVLCRECHKIKHSNGHAQIGEDQMPLFNGTGEAWRM